MAEQTLNLSSGAIDWTLPWIYYDVTGRDISADTVKLSLGTDESPGAWITPDILTFATQTVQDFLRTHPGASSTLPPAMVLHYFTAQLLVGGGLAPAVGSYALWGQVGDAPVVRIVKTPLRVIIV